MELQGKVALVTGASRGIGAHVAEELAKRGADLFITWTASEGSKAKADKVMAGIEELGLKTKVHGIAVDLSQPDGPAQTVKACMEHFKQIDVVVNNAGTDMLRSVPDTTLDDYQRVMDLNLRAPFFLVQAALPHLRKPARIINISSMASRTGFPEAVVYSMSKAGMEGMTRSMARAFGVDGTTVNAVAPGVIRTDMVATWDEETIAGEAAFTPVQKRIGETDDVAQVVAWLAGESSRWVSGQTISASGGALLI